MRIGIVYPNTSFDFDTIPSMYNAAALLAKEGYKVDIFTAEDKTQPLLARNSDNIKFCYHVPRWERKGIERYIPAKYLSRTQVWRTHRIEPYKCFIGVDPHGLVRASSLSSFLNVPLIYYSLELLLTSEIEAKSDANVSSFIPHSPPTPKRWRLLAPTRSVKAVMSHYADRKRIRSGMGFKFLESKLSRKSAFTIIQDADRASLLMEDNELDEQKVVLVPNSPIGPARRTIKRLWHERFKLPANAKVVLYMGSLGAWTGVDYLVESTASWPKEWVLVIHVRSVSDLAYCSKLKISAPHGKVYFSTEPVSREQLVDLIDSSEIGAAFYIPQPGSLYTQENIKTIGLSSGKTAQYLSSGLPVIVSPTTGLQQFVESNGCGIIVKDWKQMVNYLKHIDRNYSRLSNNAISAFNKHLDFSVHFGNVVQRINSL